VDLIRPYTLKGKDGTEIDFMFPTMFDPASSWFEIVALPVTTDAVIPLHTKYKGAKGIKTHINKEVRPGLAIIHIVNTSSMTTEVILNFTLKPYVNHLGSSVSQPASRTQE
jgi:hypothetical protein